MSNLILAVTRVFLLNHIHRVKLKGSFETLASGCESIAEHSIIKYNGMSDLSTKSDTMDYSFQWEFILSKRKKKFIQNFQDLLMNILPDNTTTPDTCFSFFLSLALFY